MYANSYSSGCATNTIASICGITTPLECEQIIDIVLGRNREQCTGNKEVDFANITRDWDAREWKSVVREFYVGFAQARLPAIALFECDPGLKQQLAIESGRETAPYKKAPDPFYIQEVCTAYQRPEPGTPISNSREVLISVYVAISGGENYSTVGYPPKEFIEKVLMSDASQQDFYATVLSFFQQRTSFEQIVCSVAEQDKALVKEMRKRYKELVQKDIGTTMKKVANTANVVAGVATVNAEKATRAIKKNVYTPPEDNSRRSKRGRRVKQGAQVAGGVAATAGIEVIRAKIFVPYGIVMLAINGVATPAKFWVGVNYIKMLSSSGNGLFKMFLPSLWSIFSSFIPLIGCICVVMMLFTGLIPGKSNKKRIAYIVMCLAVLCTTYSIVALIKLAIALIASWFTANFTPENIARVASKGVLDGVKGVFTGIGEFVGGLFE